MKTRPTAVTILALYLLIPFGIAIVTHLAGAIRNLPPYAPSEWLLLTLPHLLAFGAGIALWQMLRIGALLWFCSVVLGWLLAISLGTGFFPNLTVAIAVSLTIVAASTWVLVHNWHLLKPLNTPTLPRAEPHR